MTSLAAFSIIVFGFALALSLAPAVYITVLTTILACHLALGAIMNHDRNRFVRGIIGIALLAIVIVDVILAEFFGEQGTFSQVLLRWAQEQPFVSFLGGFIMGHIFWKNDGGKPWGN